MIGLSLSLCVADILRGRVKEEDVTFIVAGCAIHESDPEHLEYVLSSYAGNYWYPNPEEGKAIARRLLADAQGQVIVCGICRGDCVKEPPPEGDSGQSLNRGCKLDNESPTSGSRHRSTKF
jgi:hypothetical protein